MKFPLLFHRVLWLILLFQLLVATSAAALQPADASSWRSSFTLYGWFPGVEGDLNYDLGGSGDASIDAGDILDALDFAFMGAFETGNGQWAIVTDVIYLKLSAGNTTSVALPVGSLSTDVDQDLDGWQVAVYGGYNVYRSGNSTMDALVGVRYLTLDAEASLNIDGPLPGQLPGRKLEDSADFWDGVIGVRGHAGFAGNWFIPYHFDIGTGDSDLTWQVLAGVGYAVSWGEVIAAYRHLEWDTGDDGLLEDFSFSGPAVGIKFNF